MKKLTTKQLIQKQLDHIDDFTNQVYQINKKLDILNTFMVETQIHIARNVQDLHNRLNYIKTYVGIDEFFEALKDKKDDSDNPSL